ncbi:MBL fold metallo-hydrolase [Prevotella sp. MA2016]|uniref:MBL fold metallo-hydrolase n=1 Tax=Prevotella sp. MA2016 TaxID=1408310 RepID=UPI000490F794|nr:MBL fold metallo-hydrolase [Prevotella sp. MA2016]
MLNIKTFSFNLLDENTYVVSDDSQECVIIDCGAFYPEERQALVNYINTNQLKPVHLLSTHGHFDHNFGINTVYDTWGLKPEIAAEDEWLITDIPGQFEAMAGVKLDWTFPQPGHYFVKGEIIRFGNHAFEVLPTPGHTPGGVTFYCAEEKVAFTGDTLFRMSIGRTDFERGSYTEMMNSLKTVIAQLPTDTAVYCGHGPKTTIGDEKLYNPYFRS